MALRRWGSALRESRQILRRGFVSADTRWAIAYRFRALGETSDCRKGAVRTVYDKLEVAVADLRHGAVLLNQL